jgi:hypothetical protein
MQFADGYFPRLPVLGLCLMLNASRGRVVAGPHQGLQSLLGSGVTVGWVGLQVFPFSRVGSGCGGSSEPGCSGPAALLRVQLLEAADLAAPRAPYALLQLLGDDAKVRTGFQSGRCEDRKSADCPWWSETFTMLAPETEQHHLRVAVYNSNVLLKHDLLGQVSPQPRPAPQPMGCAAAQSVPGPGHWRAPLVRFPPIIKYADGRGGPQWHSSPQSCIGPACPLACPRPEGSAALFPAPRVLTCGAVCCQVHLPLSHLAATYSAGPPLVAWHGLVGLKGAPAGRVRLGIACQLLHRRDAPLGAGERGPTAAEPPGGGEAEEGGPLVEVLHIRLVQAEINKKVSRMAGGATAAARPSQMPPEAVSSRPMTAIAHQHCQQQVLSYCASVSWSWSVSPLSHACSLARCAGLACRAGPRFLLGSLLRLSPCVFWCRPSRWPPPTRTAGPAVAAPAGPASSSRPPPRPSSTR